MKIRILITVLIAALVTTMSHAQSRVTEEIALKVAKAIAVCDYRVSLSKYVSRDDPWLITVGESVWQRRLLIQEIKGGQITLAVLAKSESREPDYDVSFDKVERIITLANLTKEGYISVKAVLNPRDE